MENLRKEKRTMAILAAVFAVLMSVPYLVPCCGFLALLGFVPLLCMDRIADSCGIRRLWPWHYSAFVLWNAATTFWVCNATVGGGIFAILANSLQMSLVFGLFRLSKKAFRGTLPYIFLAVAWIAWERYYLTWAQISWPWLVLGNAFARTPGLVQWYEYTGSLGGSLWVWASSLGIFGMMCALADGRAQAWNAKARIALPSLLAAVVFGPMAVSAVIWHKYEETSDPLEVAVIQPNIDPYEKFEALSQDSQNALLEGQMLELLKDRDPSEETPLLLLAPETFTQDVIVNDIAGGRTWRRFDRDLSAYRGVNLIFGASAREYVMADERPSQTARQIDEGLWRESRNSSLIADGTGRTQIFHKSKLVVGVEMTPYPAVFRPLDDLLGGLMGRCIGQDEASVLDVKGGGRTVPVGTPICYESVYGEYCTGYVRKGAQLLAVITNDAWWGDTPGYRQHLSYASLRAIELRRDIARCANTGISAFIDQRGRVLEQTGWMERTELEGAVNLNSSMTFFAREGDITGRICVMLFCLLGLGMLVRLKTRHGEN